MIDCFFIREEELLKNRKREVGEMIGREAACKQLVTNCNHFGIAAAIREAFARNKRNCDVFSKTEVLEVLEDRSFSKEDTIEWLYDEAKGEAK